jgi:RimJ/RimL family protein N-acetyltransferase
MPPGIETLLWHLSKVKKGMYYKIVKDNTIIGGINLYNLGSRQIRLGALFIEPSFHNQGIGAKAIDFIEDKYSDYKKWSLDTPYKNYRNQRFYEKHGYVKVGESKPLEEFDFWLFEYEKEII